MDFGDAMAAAALGRGLTTHEAWSHGLDGGDFRDRGGAAVPAARGWRLLRWGEDSLTHEAWTHGLDRGDFRDRGE